MLTDGQTDGWSDIMTDFIRSLRRNDLIKWRNDLIKSRIRNFLLGGQGIFQESEDHEMGHFEYTIFFCYLRYNNFRKNGLFGKKSPLVRKNK